MIEPANTGKRQRMIKRDLKDVIVIANTCGCYMFNLFNGIPVKEYHGDKNDISFFSLTRYLKQIKNLDDVRVKIMDDFYPLLNFPPQMSNFHLGLMNQSLGGPNGG